MTDSPLVALQQALQCFDQWRPAHAVAAASTRAMMDDLAKAVRAFLSTPLAQTWEPIATAPKDGTKIVVLGAIWSDKTFRAGVSWWLPNSAGWCGFRTEQILGWMPLPAPPDTGLAALPEPQEEGLK